MSEEKNIEILIEEKKENQFWNYLNKQGINSILELIKTAPDPDALKVKLYMLMTIIANMHGFNIDEEKIKKGDKAEIQKLFTLWRTIIEKKDIKTITYTIKI
ncbi:MAG: hypothetical protein QXY70_00695 [Nanopusillaceae archaeon]